MFTGEPKIESPEEKEAELNRLRGHLKNVILQEEAAGEAHFKREFTEEEHKVVLKAQKKKNIVKEEELEIDRNISPDKIIGSLHDDDLLAFRDYYVKFEDIIEHRGQLKEDYETIKRIYDRFVEAHAKFEQDEALSHRESAENKFNDPDFINRRNLWAFLANKFSRVMFQAEMAHRKK